MPSLPAVQCLQWFHIYVRAHIFVHFFFSYPLLRLCTSSRRDGCSSIAQRPADGAPRELATLLAMPFLISAFPAIVIFFLTSPPSIFHISGSDSHSSKWDLKCLNRGRSVFVISFVRGNDCRSFFPPSGYRMRSGSPEFFSIPKRLIRSSLRCHRVPDVATGPSAPRKWEICSRGGVGGRNVFIRYTICLLH